MTKIRILFTFKIMFVNCILKEFNFLKYSYTDVSSPVVSYDKTFMKNSIVVLSNTVFRDYNIFLDIIAIHLYILKNPELDMVQYIKVILLILQ